MRIIKFRGKEQMCGKWLYGSLAVYFNDEMYILEKTEDERGYLTMEERAVDYETVGQFTGLFDYDGKEIYEGDIIESVFLDTTFRKTVIYGNKLSAFVLMPDNEEDNITYIGQDYIRTYKFRVVGNIYDNPELVTINIKDYSKAK